MVGWFIVRIGGERSRDDYVDDVALIYADVNAIPDEVARPILLGQIRCRFGDGSVNTTRIKRNATQIPGDYAVMMLIDIDKQVEGCDDGEIAAVPVDLRSWLLPIAGPHTDEVRTALNALIGSSIDG